MLNYKELKKAILSNCPSDFSESRFINLGNVKRILSYYENRVDNSVAQLEEVINPLYIERYRELGVENDVINSINKSLGSDVFILNTSPSKQKKTIENIFYKHGDFGINRNLLTTVRGGFFEYCVADYYKKRGHKVFFCNDIVSNNEYLKEKFGEEILEYINSRDFQGDLGADLVVEDEFTKTRTLVQCKHSSKEKYDLYSACKEVLAGSYIYDIKKCVVVSNVRDTGFANLFASAVNGSKNMSLAIIDDFDMKEYESIYIEFMIQISSLKKNRLSFSTIREVFENCYSLIK